MSYWRFFAMIITSTIVMYGLMYANSYALEHLYFSESRVYMALYMGAMMAVIMLAFMLGMYANRTVNIAIFVGSAVIFVGAIYLFRSQDTIQDRSWMRAMIPHHSIAVLTSSRANFTDPRVAKLASDIVTAQNREISEMRFLIEDITENGEAEAGFPTGENSEPASIETLAVALETPEIAGIRPAPLKAEEIQRALSDAGKCEFSRAVDADPVLVASDTGAVIKVSGSLIRLDISPDNAAGQAFSADGVNVEIRPDSDDGEGANLIFDLQTEPPLRIGFNGYWTCNSANG